MSGDLINPYEQERQTLIPGKDIDPALLVPASTANPLLSQDTLSVSSASATQVGGISASSPQLASALYKFELQLSEMTSKMLDKWLESLHKIAQDIEDELKSPAGRRRVEEQSLAYRIQQENLALSNPAAATQVTVDLINPSDFRNTARLEQLKANMAEGLSAYRQDMATKSVDAGEAAFVVSSVMLAVTMLGASAVQTSVELTPATSSIESAANHFVQLIPADFRAELGLLGAMFGGALINLAVLPQLSSAAAKGQKTDPKAMAESYATKVLETVNGKVIDTFLERLIVAKMGPQSAENTQQLVITLKTILASSALAALYEANNSWKNADGSFASWKITGQEFEGLLSNPSMAKDKEGDLAAFIQAQFGKLSGEAAENLRTSLISYMDTRPSMKSLFSLSDVIDRVADMAYFERDKKVTNGLGG